MNVKLPAKTFVDTNILVYAHDLDGAAKHTKAKERVELLWQHHQGVLSLQVLQEFYVTLTRKIKSPLSPAQVKSMVQLYGEWEVVTLGVSDMLDAIDLATKHKFSFWDALIVSAALKADCAVLLSEDLQHQQKIGPLTIQNPFWVR